LNRVQAVEDVTTKIVEEKGVVLLLVKNHVLVLEPIGCCCFNRTNHLQTRSKAGHAEKNIQKKQKQTQKNSNMAFWHGSRPRSNIVE
jgi:hypothetical protein